MVTTDTSKLFIRNVGVVWGLLAYLVVCILIIGGLSIALCYPFIESLVSAGVFNEIFAVLTNNVANLQVGQIFGSLADIIVKISGIIGDNLASIVPMVIILFFIICVLGGFLVGLSELAVADCLYGYMGSNSKIGFFSCFIKNIVKSVKLQLAKLAVVLPCNIVIIAAIIACLMLFTIGNFWVSVFAPFVLTLVFILLFALKNTLFSAWVPCVIVKDYGAWSALRQSFGDVTKNFGKIFGRYFVLSVAIVAVTIASIILTASVGLILTIPACILFASIMNMVIYFYMNGLKFYVDDDEIVASKKREDWESINSLKYII